MKNKIILKAENVTDTQNFTSRGTQSKWLFKNKWYKKDSLGYESLAETISSRLLSYTNIQDYVSYSPIKIEIEGCEYNACVSENFLKPNYEIIPLQKLHRIVLGTSLSTTLSKMPDLTNCIKYVCDFVIDTTKLYDFPKYLTTLLEFDSLILNDDRHYNNICVLRNTKTNTFFFCPIFDNGLSLLSDIITYPMNNDIYALIDKVEAKPFDRSFQNQVEAAEKLYGCQLTLDRTNLKTDNLFSGLESFYEKECIERAKSVLLEQLRKYPY